MGYKLTQAANPFVPIDTQEYVLMKTSVRFTEINSCVGIIVRTGMFLSAFHLVEFGVDDSNADDSPRFDSAGQLKLQGIIKGLPVPSIDSITLIGWYNTWLNGTHAQSFIDRGRSVQIPAQPPVPGLVELVNWFLMEHFPLIRDPINNNNGFYSAKVNKASPGGVLITRYR